ESAVLDRQGGLLLERTADMPYMEGLGQARWLLEDEPIRTDGGGDYERLCNFRWNIDQLKRWQVGDVIFFS
ncbi:MAG: hypothetical protein ACR2QF_05320, partial [Geminicoccaceae bacterium]